MRCVLTVRSVPRRAARLDAGVAAVETVAAAALAHVAAGGGTPDPVSLTFLALLGYGAGLAVLARGWSIRVLAPLMVAAQFFLHAWWAGAGAAHAHGPAVHDGHAALPPDSFVGLPDSAMLLAHVVAGCVAALSWALRRRAVDVLLRWSADHVVAVPARRVPRPFARATRPAPTGALRLAPARGPPARLRLATS